MKKAIFLSASIPDPQRNPVYYKSADITAIRESVRALATYILPKTTLVWGGHPAITPMIRVVADNIGVSVQERVIMYQTLFFENIFSKDNEAFEQIVLTPKYETRDESLFIMRHYMLSHHEYKAGVFIGGMEGVEEEFYMFKKLQPDTPVFPIYSTGGAAQILFNEYEKKLPEELKDDYSYYSLFRRLLRFDSE